MDRDYIVVGQGLAGSVLALTLTRAGKKVLVINQTRANSASMVAAGLFNPITGKVMKKTWKADQLFPYLQRFYSWAEKLTQSHFFHPLTLYRPFLTVQEQNDWMAKSCEEEFAPYLEAIYGQSTHPSLIYDPYGGIALQQSGYLEIPVFLEACKNYLLRQDSYLEEVFDEGDLTFHDRGIAYKNLSAAKIIYCNGVAAARSQYFNWLPFRPVKGELLWAEFEKPYEHIFNRGVFMFRHSENISKVGATYDWRNTEEAPTAHGKKELLDKLNKLTPMSFKIIDQKAGIRPATKDRRPFIGLHPAYKPLGIFNGLGAKGVSLAPYFADRFVEFLERNGALDSEVSINRYF